MKNELPTLGNTKTVPRSKTNFVDLLVTFPGLRANKNRIMRSNVQMRAKLKFQLGNKCT